jgi:hypothetical protein
MVAAAVVPMQRAWLASLRHGEDRWAAEGILTRLVAQSSDYDKPSTVISGHTGWRIERSVLRGAPPLSKQRLNRYRWEHLAICNENGAVLAETFIVVMPLP